MPSGALRVLPARPHPLGIPEYFRPGKAQAHRRLTQTIARLFDAVIANSRATADALRHFLSSVPARRLLDTGIHVARPGVSTFTRSAGMPNGPQGPDSVPYFVVLGT